MADNVRTMGPRNEPVLSQGDDVESLIATAGLRERVFQYANDGESRGGAALLLEYNKQRRIVKEIRGALVEILKGLS